MGNKNKKYYEDEVQCRCGKWGGQLIKFEKKCFGWRFLGYEKQSEITGVDDHGNIKRSIFKNLYFKRVSPYTNNFLFKLTELLDKIISFVRRILVNLFPLAFIACLAVTLLGGGGDADKIAPKMWMLLAGVYGGLIAATLLFGLLGFIWKKIFKIEENLETAMTEAGYEYEE